MSHQTTTEAITTIGIELGKNTFHLIGMDAHCRVWFREEKRTCASYTTLDERELVVPGCDPRSLFACRVIGWAVSDSLHKELALETLCKTLTVRRPLAGLIRQADRGSQYCSTAYQAELRERGI